MDGVGCYGCFPQATNAAHSSEASSGGCDICDGKGLNEDATYVDEDGGEEKRCADAHGYCLSNDDCGRCSDLHSYFDTMRCCKAASPSRRRSSPPRWLAASVAAAAGGTAAAASHQCFSYGDPKEIDKTTTVYFPE